MEVAEHRIPARAALAEQVEQMEVVGAEAEAEHLLAAMVG